jgi:hypothetical protein
MQSQFSWSVDWADTKNSQKTGTSIMACFSFVSHEKLNDAGETRNKKQKHY